MWRRWVGIPFSGSHRKGYGEGLGDRVLNGNAAGWLDEK